MSALRFAFLGSGSRGNALLVEAGGTRLLVDCGFSAREMTRRMHLLDRDPASLDAILVTHEHADHSSGVARVARRYGVPVMTTHGTRAAIGDEPGVDWRIISPHDALDFKALTVQPVAVPHDAREPIQFTFVQGKARLGLLTDLGHVTPHVISSYGGCQAMVLEANHDPAMLEAGPYPPALKQRVGGPFGHLSNGQSAGLLEQADTTGLERLVAAHLSEKNNDFSLARETLAAALGWAPERVETAQQDTVSEWFEL